MAKNVTIWSPDTCGCVIHYEWDTEVPAQQRVHTAVAGGHVCGDHAQHAADHHARHAVVAEENQRKNRALAKLIELGHNHLDLSWHFDADRTLRISGPSLRGQKPNLGLSKVVIE